MYPAPPVTSMFAKADTSLAKPSTYDRGMGLLSVDRATKLYGETAALHNVSLQIEAASFTAIVGKSGCGKSTLLNLCGAMDLPTSGTVTVDGQITSALSDSAVTALRRDKIGFVFQSFQLMQTLSVVENVELPLLLARKPNARKQALDRLHWVELDGLESRMPHQLSGGQQQRVAIARSLVHNPKLLLADEPTGNLDSATGEVILQLLQSIKNQFGTAIIMATHSAESAAVADRTVCMKDGHIVAAKDGHIVP